MESYIHGIIRTDKSRLVPIANHIPIEYRESYSNEKPHLII